MGKWEENPLNHCNSETATITFYVFPLFKGNSIRFSMLKQTLYFVISEFKKERSIFFRTEVLKSSLPGGEPRPPSGLSPSRQVGGLLGCTHLPRHRRVSHCLSRNDLEGG